MDIRKCEKDRPAAKASGIGRGFVYYELNGMRGEKLDNRNQMGKNKAGVILPVAPNLSEMSDAYLKFKEAFPEMLGFSPRNIKHMRKFAESGPDFELVQRVVAQIPWRTNISLMDKMKEEESCIWYAHKANHDAINAKGHSDIIVRKFLGNKKEYMDLLLLADEQEDMIDKYLERGEMFVLENDGVKGECVVTKEADGVYEIKNIAVLPDCQRNGYGKSMIDFVFSYYNDCQTMLVGTGDVPSTLRFYQKCGFAESHRIKNFFTDNYDHPMFEDGKQLIDMVYLKKVR